MNKYKYIVEITVINFDCDGNPKTESWDKSFENGNLPTMRNEAIEYANQIIMMFEQEMPPGHEFDSGIEAKFKAYKNVNGYSVNIYFFIDDLDYQIEGDHESQVENMEVEEFEFHNNGFDYPIINY